MDFTFRHRLHLTQKSLGLPSKPKTKFSERVLRKMDFFRVTFDTWTEWLTVNKKTEPIQNQLVNRIPTDNQNLQAPEITITSGRRGGRKLTRNVGK